MLGFVILRHVSRPNHNKLWIECYNCIRKFYDNKIMIVDDNSDYSLITNIKLANTIIVNSVFKKRGELLPYYYFYKLKPFDTAVLLHDSMFIMEKIDFENVDNIRFLWHFDKWHYHNTKLDIRHISSLNYSNRLLKLYRNRINWHGCFGAMTVIKHTYLKYIVDKYNLFYLLKTILSRDDRMSLERIIALISFNENVVDKNNCSIFGSIVSFPDRFKLDFKDYKQIKNQKIIKVWTGR